MTIKSKRVLWITIALLVVAFVSIVLLFSYRTDLFVNENRDTLRLALDDRTISIPLKHKYTFTSPSISIFKSKATIAEISAMFVDSVGENDEIKAVEIDDITFLYLYTNNEYVQSLFIEPYDVDKGTIRVGVNSFIPACLYEYGGGTELLQSTDDLVDGSTYKLRGKLYEKSFDMLYRHLSNIYVIDIYEDNCMRLTVDGKTINLEEEN